MNYEFLAMVAILKSKSMGHYIKVASLCMQSLIIIISCSDVENKLFTSPPKRKLEGLKSCILGIYTTN